MKLSYLDTVRDAKGGSMRVRVILEDDGEGGIYVHRVLDAAGLATRGPEESEDAYDVRHYLTRTAPEALTRIYRERHDRYAECLAQEAGFAHDLAWTKADELTHEMCVEMSAAVTDSWRRPWQRKVS